VGILSEQRRITERGVRKLVSKIEQLWCTVCDLVFVPSYQRLTADEELKRYDLHQNNPDDKRYKKFLERLFKPLNDRLPSSSSGLDFGSGPGPTLHQMFMECGHEMNIYDCFYADDLSVFELSYDFITATEVVEHLFNPQKELDRLWLCLRPGGYLGIMTGFVESKEAFKKWYYKNDETHVAFYSEKTFKWLQRRWQASLELIGNGVVIFRKNN
jgi:SAM-dependent methyltransferase